MARGGARPGAGRKAGAVTTKTREVANKVAESGDTPLEALGELRRWAMDQFRTARDSQDFLRAAKSAEVAADWAAKEAPYVHPKLAAIEHAGPGGGPIEVTTIELVGPDADDAG